MRVTIGTFNLNNLFSRYNFKGEIEAANNTELGVESDVQYVFSSDGNFRFRMYLGKMVEAKDPGDTQTIAQRILNMNVDVLAVQEVEDIDTLRQFNREYLGGMYSEVVLIEGNDQRLIDVGLLSKLPLGGITSWQRLTHLDDPSRKIFGRDMLEVELLNPTRKRKLLTLFINHLKSHYVEPGGDEEVAGQEANLRRAKQAEMVAWVIAQRTRPDSRYIVLGDMNDPVGSPYLRPMTQGLINALENPQETRTAKADTPPPSTKAWTYRHKEAGQPAIYTLFDQIWLSPALGGKLRGAWIDRRTKHSGDGGDHDPAWIELEL